VKAPCARPRQHDIARHDECFFRQASVPAGHPASSSEPFTKLTCGRAVTVDEVSGRLASKSTPIHVFGSDSASADREKPQVKTASPRRDEHFRCECSATAPVFFIAKPPAVSCILTNASAGRQGWPIQQRAFSINRIGRLRTGLGLGELWEGKQCWRLRSA